VARRPGGEASLRARIEAAPGLTAAEAHKVAGFLEGECHLALVPNNGDGWRCAFSVALRDDDRGILVQVRRSLGLGQLSARAAHRSSQPQVVWVVGSKLECAALTELLDAHSFRGRKLAEYEIWREAVALWGARRYGLAPGALARVEWLATQLKEARIYREPSALRTIPSLTDPYATQFFAGFFSGEGSFGLRGRAARFVVKLRRDDRPLLDAFCRDFGIGTVCDVETPDPWSPAAVWHVTGARDVLRGIALFDSAGLLGRKERQFRAWRPGAEAVAHAKIAGDPVDEQVVDSARRNLARATAYVPPTNPLRSDPGYADARTAYISVLRAWAALSDGPLSCTAYQAARSLHRHWPKRETIAIAFGSWHEALRSAGLAGRAARRPSTH
jgi:hypothetical protein